MLSRLKTFIPRITFDHLPFLHNEHIFKVTHDALEILLRKEREEKKKRKEERMEKYARGLRFDENGTADETRRGSRRAGENSKEIIANHLCDFRKLRTL